MRCEGRGRSEVDMDVEGGSPLGMTGGRADSMSTIRLVYKDKEVITSSSLGDTSTSLYLLDG